MSERGCPSTGECALMGNERSGLNGLDHPSVRQALPIDGRPAPGGGKLRGRAARSYPPHASSREIGLGIGLDFFRENSAGGCAVGWDAGWDIGLGGAVMAMVRRVRSPFMRAIAALRSTQGTVFVIRHGSTDRNRGGVGQDQIRGHADIPMTAGGESEVFVTARLISAERIGLIHASDLQRTARTAEIVSEENVGYPDVELTSALRSWDMGAPMEGKVTTPDVVAQIRAWVADDGVVPPGGESFRGFANRLLAYAEPVFAAAVEHGDTLCIVAHGRCAQVIDFWVAAGCDEDCMHREFVEYLAEEPDTVPPGGGIRYKNDGLGWVGQVIGSRVASLGTQIAAGAYVRPANELARDENGMAS